MANTLILEPVWGPQKFFMDLLVVKQYSKLSSYAISRKTSELNLKKS